MIEYLAICYASSLCVLTLYNLFQDYESILGWFPYAIERTPIINKLRKPLYACLVCMSSIWGSGFYFAFTLLFSDLSAVRWILGVLIIAGFSIINSGLLQVSDFLLDKAEMDDTKI